MAAAADEKQKERSSPMALRHSKRRARCQVYGTRTHRVKSAGWYLGWSSTSRRSGRAQQNVLSCGGQLVRRHSWSRVALEARRCIRHEKLEAPAFVECGFRGRDERSVLRPIVGWSCDRRVQVSVVLDGAK